MSDEETTIRETIADEPFCAKCGSAHPFDTSVPSDGWNRVIRAGGLPDFLCLQCIVMAFANAGAGFTATLWGDDMPRVTIEMRSPGETSRVLGNTAGLAGVVSEGERLLALIPQDQWVGENWYVVIKREFYKYKLVHIGPRGDMNGEEVRNTRDFIVHLHNNARALLAAAKAAEGLKDENQDLQERLDLTTERLDDAISRAQRIVSAQKHLANFLETAESMLDCRNDENPLLGITASIGLLKAEFLSLRSVLTDAQAENERLALEHAAWLIEYNPRLQDAEKELRQVAKVLIDAGARVTTSQAQSLQELLATLKRDTENLLTQAQAENGGEVLLSALRDMAAAQQEARQLREDKDRLVDQLHDIKEFLDGEEIPEAGNDLERLFYFSQRVSVFAELKEKAEQRAEKAESELALLHQLTEGTGKTPDDITAAIQYFLESATEEDKDVLNMLFGWVKGAARYDAINEAKTVAEKIRREYLEEISRPGASRISGFAENAYAATVAARIVDAILSLLPEPAATSQTTNATEGQTGRQGEAEEMGVTRTSVITHCKACGMEGVNLPHVTDCGNCGSSNTYKTDARMEREMEELFQRSQRTQRWG